MTEQERLKLIVKTLDRKKAEDIRVMEIGNLTIVADYFIIASGTSTTQVKSLADEVDFILGQQGVHVLHTEGYQNANWIVLDYGDLVVHVFHAETRRFYSLERLWSDGKELDAAQFLDDVD